jgi:hypothetical protein
MVALRVEHSAVEKVSQTAVSKVGCWVAMKDCSRVVQMDGCSADEKVEQTAVMMADKRADCWVELLVAQTAGLKVVRSAVRRVFARVVWSGPHWVALRVSMKVVCLVEPRAAYSAVWKVELRAGLMAVH